MFEPIYKQDLLSKEDIARIYETVDTFTLEPGTTGGDNSNRLSDITWLHRSNQWNWLYEIIEPWIKSVVPSNYVYADTQPDSIQFTRYNQNGFYGWHPDNGNANTRLVSTTILLKSAIKGGLLQIQNVSLPELIVGSGITFSSHAEHRITEIIEGTRDSLVIWLSAPAGTEIQQPESLPLPTYVKTNWKSSTKLENTNITDTSDKYYMSEQDVQAGLILMVTKGFRFPYGILPGTRPGGWHTNIATSWKRWREYKRNGLYNPPGFLRHLTEYSHFDSSADPMPSWYDIYNAAIEAKLKI